MLVKIFFLICSLAITYSLEPTTSYAIDLQSPRFKIESGSIDMNEEISEEAVVYTIESIYGPAEYNEFQSKGLYIKPQLTNDSISLSLSQSLINLTNQPDKKSAVEKIELSSPTDSLHNNKISVLQEYPLKNFTGETLGLEFSEGETSIFRRLPNQNTGDKPAQIFETNLEKTNTIFFRLNSSPNNIEGTYETVVNFIISPDL